MDYKLGCEYGENNGRRWWWCWRSKENIKSTHNNTTHTCGHIHMQLCARHLKRYVRSVWVASVLQWIHICVIQRRTYSGTTKRTPNKSYALYTCACVWTCWARHLKLLLFPRKEKKTVQIPNTQRQRKQDIGKTKALAKWTQSIVTINLFCLLAVVHTHSIRLLFVLLIYIIYIYIHTWKE